MKLDCAATLGLAVLITGGLACDVGGTDPGGIPPKAVDADEPALVECTAEFSLTGTLNPPVTPNPGAGCVPTGTWTVNLAMTDPGNCAQAFEWQAQYVYSITGDSEIGYTYTYLGDPADENVYLKVTAAGGTCNGSFEHYTNGTKDLLNIKAFEDDLLITGTAYFERYFQAQLP